MSGLRSWAGKEFHKRGPAAAKVLSPQLLYVRMVQRKSGRQLTVESAAIMSMIDAQEADIKLFERFRVFQGF